MTQENWAQQAIARFFSRQKHHSQLDFHQLAYDVTGAPFLSEVETPGSMSYTVICTWPEEENHKPEVVSFREEPGAHLDDRIMRVAREMHGCGFVPEMRAVYAPGVPNLKNGLVEGTDPPLKIYIMSYIEGTACLNVLARQVEMDGEQETCHRLFMTDLSL